MTSLRRIAAVLPLALVAAAAPVAAANAATAKPTIASLTASVQHLSAAGGSVTLRAHVKNATSCTFTETRAGHVVATKKVACSKGSATATLRSSASTTQSLLTIQFSLRAANAAGTAVRRTALVQQDGMVAPIQIVSAGTLAPGVVNTAYAAALTATGGTSPYTWSIVSGTLPTGLTLATDGTISGTPTGAAQASLTVRVTDADGRSATATIVIPISAPPTTSDQSVNWAGYVVNGGPFTSATGTFNVPTVTTTSSNSDVAEWVGIDGATNDNLIQAGVDEIYDRFAGTVDVEAWWEILPANATFISLPVHVGDRITISIQQIQSTQWTIKILNVTTGQSFTTTQTYTGQGTSAEWIVEAPTSARGQTALAPFSPNVTFTGIGFTGVGTSFDDVLMAQGGTVVATPSSLGANGFAVAYGSTPPPLP